MPTIDADLPENSLILGLFKPVVTMEALTDDIVMTYLQLAQDKDAILSADDFLTKIKAKRTCNLAEQDPDLRISQLVSSYLTILRKCRMADLYKDRIVRTVCSASCVLVVMEVGCLSLLCPATEACSCLYWLRSWRNIMNLSTDSVDNGTNGTCLQRR
jgi:hypothetical protein